MPPRVREYLNNRGISDKVIFDNEIYWTGLRIGIPVIDENNTVLFNKYRRDPEMEIGPKYTFDRGAHVALYGRKNLSADTIIICEGEFDALVLMAQGYAAVTSTAGAGTFKSDWAKLFKGKEVYICLDNDAAGRAGADKIAMLIPQAKIAILPEGIKDITDFFMVKDKAAFDLCLANAYVPEIERPAPPKLTKKAPISGGSKIERAKSVPISNYVKLDYHKKALCPLHREHTPSFQVFPDNKFKCFGCGRHGDVIDLVREMFGWDIGQALDELVK